jgi:hypothetical protein
MNDTAATPGALYRVRTPKPGLDYCQWVASTLRKARRDLPRASSGTRAEKLLDKS